MTKQIIEIANRFIAEEACSRQDLVELKAWLSNPASSVEVEAWLWEHWAMSREDDSNAMIEVVFRQIEEYQNIDSKPEFSFSRIIKVYQRIAAFLLIPLIGLGFLYWGSHNNQSVGQYTETIAPRGQKSQIVLADGTKVWLNSDTKIKYPGNFSKNQRDVYLVGEAFFEVAHNAAQPFIVNVHGFKIRVLGTSFNVSSYNEDASIQAVLVTGKISAGKNALFAKTTELNPGERLVYNKSNEETTTDKVDIDLYASWVNGYLLFENEPTPFVFRKLERYYNQKIIVGEGLEKITFSGKLDLKENLNDVLESIAFASKVKITQQNGNYTIN